MIIKDIKIDFDDLLIVPRSASSISSRKNVNIYDKNDMLPLFTAPMDTVVNIDNLNVFKENKIRPIIPRTYTPSFYSGGGIYIYDNVLNKDIKIDDNWYAIGLTDFEKLIEPSNNPYFNPNSVDTLHILVDIANGNMEKLYNLVKKGKTKYGNKLQLMVGNVANPQTYEILSNLGADYIRVGVGNGGGCLTSQNVGIGYPLASLIDECYNISCRLEKPAKIVADGGMKNYSDIIKALALGADMVMIGSLLNRSLESAGETFKANVKHTGVESWTEPGELVNQFDDNVKNAFKNGARFYKKFRGMSTKVVQKSLGNKILKTSEGVTRMNPVEYTLDGWVENFSHYLASAMSYTGSNTLKDFIGNVDLVRISGNSFNRFNK